MRTDEETIMRFLKTIVIGSFKAIFFAAVIVGTFIMNCIGAIICAISE